MSTATTTAAFHNRYDDLMLNRSTADSKTASTPGHHDLYLEADEIAARLAELKSKWTASERIVRKMIGRARRDRLAVAVFGCKSS